ncbi:Na+/H+ antiporter subunit D [Marinicrinis sediminis]|uniref:Na+/H+ antiporter subunit D n=1 Tax=Marinicrinis sediminis TaxID=1652465 RepID=A0ABW5R5X6_9BACL
MNNLIVLPLLIPLCTGIVLIFLKERVEWQRMLSAISMLLNVGVAAWVVLAVKRDGIQTLNMGGWEAPYGIVFVADMLAALLVLTTTVISAVCLFYAFSSIGEQRERHYFYSFLQFLIVGVIGSFLTGDIFNLFVCFEIMLISSYALIVLGGRKAQLRESLKYILVNIVSSILFVASVAYLYAVVGTLNMADMSVRVAEVGQGGILTVIAILFLFVFSLKAGLFLFFWLPGSYSAPPAAITALFAGLLTKVGVYAIIRVFTLIFYHEPHITHSLIGWMAALTMIAGVLGAVAYQDVNRILIYNIVYAVGFIAFGLSIANEDAIQGTIFYLFQDMIVKSLLFLLGGAIVLAAGTDRLKNMGGLIRRYPAMGWMFFIAALAVVGVPPLSGFIGKLLILRGGLGDEQFWISGISLAGSLVLLYAVMNMFMKAFWGAERMPETNKAASAQPSLKALLIPAGVLLALVVYVGIGAETILPYVSQAAETLLNPDLYIEAVLKE